LRSPRWDCDPLSGNPDLKPEISTNYELSLAYDRLQGINAGVTGFRTDLRNMIERPSGANILEPRRLWIALRASL